MTAKTPIELNNNYILWNSGSFNVNGVVVEVGQLIMGDYGSHTWPKCLSIRATALHD